MGDVVQLRPTPKPRPGNGAREHLIDLVQELFRTTNPATITATDWLLTELWCRGFKVIPLDGDE